MLCHEQEVKPCFRKVLDLGMGISVKSFSLPCISKVPRRSEGKQVLIATGVGNGNKMKYHAAAKTLDKQIPPPIPQPYLRPRIITGRNDERIIVLVCFLLL